MGNEREADKLLGARSWRPKASLSSELQPRHDEDWDFL
jgi:hypothetical protein